LYVANSGSFSISVFSIDSGSGALAAVGTPFPIGVDPLNMRLSPSGGTLYVTGQGTTTGIIEAFTMNQGVPTVVTGTPFDTGNSPYGLTLSPGGNFLYTANKLDNSISQFTVNADGSLAEPGLSLGETYSGPISLFVDKTGAYIYVANQASSNLAAYSLGSDGTLTLLTTSPFTTGANPSVIASDSGGKYLFVGNQPSSGASIESFSLDVSSGTLTEVASYTVPGSPTSIAITP
jgi:6-phosphogluconolactonase (cycloisomerase 2 family)